MECHFRVKVTRGNARLHGVSENANVLQPFHYSSAGWGIEIQIIEVSDRGVLAG
jgi:hypothetical protein